MAIISDDFDLEKTWFKTILGGNGDFYLQTTFEDEKGIKQVKSVRICTSGGHTKEYSKVKITIAKLHEEMEKAGLNDDI